MARLETLRDLKNISIELVRLHISRLLLNSVLVRHTFLEEIKQAQVGDAKIEGIKVNISKGKRLRFIEDEQEIIRFQNRKCMPQRMG